jgi:hypothetical protein
MIGIGRGGLDIHFDGDGIFGSDMLRPLSYLGAARPLMLPLLSSPSLSVPTGPLYCIYRTNFGRCRNLDA